LDFIYVIINFSLQFCVSFISFLLWWSYFKYESKYRNWWK